MTDRFEDAVRDAARGLGEGSVTAPTYHEAWQRGRRRRLVKRSALAAAGVLVFVAALSVNLGRFPGSDSTETDDVAVAVPAATPSFEATTVPTTAPVDPPTTGASREPEPLDIPTVSPTPDQEPTDVAPTVTPAPPIAASATTAPVPTPVPAQPTAAATPAPSAAPTAGPTSEAAADDPDTITAEATGPVTDEPNQTDGTSATATIPTDEERPGERPPDEPELAFTTPGIGQPASAIVVDSAAGADLACDVDGDGTVDARCTLLLDYSCSGDGEALPGYLALDTDEDGAPDTCSAIEVTACDTSGDGLGDTRCIIEFVTDADPDESPAGDESSEDPDDGE